MLTCVSTLLTHMMDSVWRTRYITDPLSRSSC